MLQIKVFQLDRKIAILSHIPVEQLALQKASVGIMELLQEPVEYKHACNLWVNPQNLYEVDRCEHPPSETIKAYIRKVKAIENERSNHGKS